MKTGGGNGVVCGAEGILEDSRDHVDGRNAGWGLLFIPGLYALKCPLSFQAFQAH